MGVGNLTPNNLKITKNKQNIKMACQLINSSRSIDCSKTIGGRQFCVEENCVAKDIPHKHDEKGLIIYSTDLHARKIPSKHKHDTEVSE